MAKWEEGSTVRDNQRRMVANTLRAGNKLTDAQKKNFSASEITSIRSSLEKETPHQKSMRKRAGVASKNKKGGGQALKKTFKRTEKQTKAGSRYGGKIVRNPKRVDSKG